MAFTDDHVTVDVHMYGPLMANPFSCRLWYLITGAAPVVGTLDTYVNEIQEWIIPEFAAVLSTNCFVGGITTRWQLATDEHFIPASDPALAGTVSGTEILPEEDCVILRRYTGQSDRNRRGRIFIPLVPEAFQNSGRLTSSAITAYQALAAVLKVAPEGDSLDGDGVVLVPCQPDFKNEELPGITNWSLVIDVHNRRDRRTPKQSLTVGVP